MKKTTLHLLQFVVLCILLVGTVSSGFAQAAPDRLPEKVDAYITETMRRLPIKGLSLAIVKGDQILYLQGYGTANIQGDPVTPQTPFLIGSVTKSFTALAARQLAAAGKLDLDAPVQTYLPDFRLADPAAIVTVRNLLDHKSGFTTLAGQANYLYAPKTTFDEVLNQLSQYHPPYQPGVKYEYSNLNYVLLAQVITRASGQPYHEYMQKNILDPLQMSNATFADHHSLPQAATGNQIFFGIRAPFDEPYTPALLGAGNLSASAEDMAHYLIPFFNQGEYRGNSLLAAQTQGWFDTSWNWHAGSPGYGSYSHTGGPDSFHANIQFVTANQETVLVAMLMNTRLDTILPGPAVYDIAYNVANITLGLPYELLSTRKLYTGWALFDSFLLFMVLSITWQAFQLKSWKNHSRAVTPLKEIITWVVIVFDLLVCIEIIILPALANSRWEILLDHRPDLAAPLFIIALSLGVIGISKIALRMRGFLLSRSKERSRLIPELKGASNG